MKLSKIKLFKDEFKERYNLFLQIQNELTDSGFNIILLNFPVFYEKEKRGNDLDIVVKEEQWEQLLDYLIKIRNYKVIDVHIDPSQILLSRFHKKYRQFSMIHVHKGIQYFGIKLLDYDDIYKNSLFVDKGLVVPNLKMEICLLCLQLFFRKKNSYYERIGYINPQRTNVDSYLNLASIPSKLNKKIITLINNRTKITNYKLFFTLIITLPTHLQLYSDILIRLKRKILPFFKIKRQGKLILLMGIDGSGKSTLTNEVIKTLSFSGYSTKSVYWGLKEITLQKLKLAILNRKKQNQNIPSNYVKKISKKSKYLASFISIALAFYYVFEYKILTWKQLLFIKHTNTFLIADRSYYDNINPKKTIENYLLYTFLPKPDLIIYCTGDLLSILNRKPELPQNILESVHFNVEFSIKYLEGKGIEVYKIDTVNTNIEDSILKIIKKL